MGRLETALFLAAPKTAASEADFLLDRCRELAGARLTGTVSQSDAALAGLKRVLPTADAYRLFGLLHELVGLAIDADAGAFQWYPPGARRLSSDEDWLLSEVFARIALPGRGHTNAPQPGVVTLAESYCAAADMMCGLFTARAQACDGGCPFGTSTARRVPGRAALQERE